MKILTLDLKNGKTETIDVPSPSINSNKIRVINKYSLISTGTESLISNFGKASFINKARQQPDRVKDVINKIRSSGFSDTYKAVINKLNHPMLMGYSAVGNISHDNLKYNFSEGDRVFTNSVHQEIALINYNMCVEIPKNVDDKSASFGAIGGIAMQSIKCIPENSKTIAIIGLGLLGQITLRILIALGYECIVYDLDLRKVELAEKFGAIGVKKHNIKEIAMQITNGEGVDCSIISAASPSSEIVNEATVYTKRKGKIVSSGLIGLNLIRDKFFKKQIELVVSNSSGDKNHRGKGSSYENISYFFNLIASQKINLLDLISEEASFEDSSNIYSFPKDSLFFSKILRYQNQNNDLDQTFAINKHKIDSTKLRVGLIGSGNFSLSTLIPTIQNSKDGYLSILHAREGISLYIAQKRFNIETITTDKSKFYQKIDALFIATPHQSHYKLLSKAIDKSISSWIEKPLVISKDELIKIRKKMFSKSLCYAIGYNRSFAPWTNYMKDKIDSQKIEVSIVVNAGILPTDHWLLDEKSCGGRILGEFCHFIDLALVLLNHTELIEIKCLERSRYYQDTGKYILNFKDGSSVNIDYRHDLPASIPKEKISVKINNKTFVNNNWKRFSSGDMLNFNFIKKGKGHRESVDYFINRVKNNNFSTKSEIDKICFSTYVALKLQKMSAGDKFNVLDCYSYEILSKS